MLKEVCLFKNMPDEALEALSHCCTRHSYPKNAVVCMEGDDTTRLFIIESGKVNVYVSGEDGKQVTLNYMGPGEYFGELSLIDDSPRSASVMTVTDSVFLTIGREQLHDFIRQNPDCALVLLQQLTQRIRDLTHSVKDLALLDVYGRVAQLLKRLANDDNCISNPKLTHQEIANMVGASREMVSRVMKELVAGGYIEQVPGAMIIKKRFPVGW